MPDDAQGGDPKAWLAGVFDRAAPTYDRVGDNYHDYFGERLVDLAGIAEGDAVLDVACAGAPRSCRPPGAWVPVAACWASICHSG